MGAEQHYQDKKISAAELLARVMRRSLKAMTPGLEIPDKEFDYWIADAKSIKGEPLELAAAIEWAIVKSGYWTGYLDSMGKFAQKVDTILKQYRGAARSLKISESAEESYSPACIALMEKFPNWTRPEILNFEPKRLTEEGIKEIIQTCSHCKGSYWVDNKRGWLDRKGKPIKLECPLCRAARTKLFQQHYRAIKQALYGKAASA